jgi:hypothetical protein
MSGVAGHPDKENPARRHREIDPAEKIAANKKAGLAVMKCCPQPILYSRLMWKITDCFQDFFLQTHFLLFCNPLVLRG